MHCITLSRYVCHAVRLYLNAASVLLFCLPSSYSTVNGTAVAGEDFVAVSGGQVSFADGQRTAFITVNIIDDAIPERMESFSIILLSVTGNIGLLIF